MMACIRRWWLVEICLLLGIFIYTYIYIYSNAFLSLLIVRLDGDGVDKPAETASAWAIAARGRACVQAGRQAVVPVPGVYKLSKCLARVAWSAVSPGTVRLSARWVRLASLVLHRWSER